MLKNTQLFGKWSRHQPNALANAQRLQEAQLAIQGRRCDEGFDNAAFDGRGPIPGHDQCGDADRSIHAMPTVPVQVETNK